MNDLSLFLYLAGIAENAQKVLCVMSAILLITVFLNCMARSTTDTGLSNRVTVFMVTLGVLFTLVSALIPPKDTLYLIAASEIGEDSINSPQGQQVLDYLETLLGN